MPSKEFSISSEISQNDQFTYEQIKQRQRNDVLEKIELDIQENTNKTIKQSLNDIDLIIRNPKLKINSLPVQNTSVNSFITPFYEEMMDEVKDVKEDERNNRLHLPVNGKSWTTPPFYRPNNNNNHQNMYNYDNFNKFFAQTMNNFSSNTPNHINHMKLMDLRTKSSSPIEENITTDFDPANYVNPQFIKGIFFKKF